MAVVHLSPEIPRSSFRRRESSKLSRLSDQSNLLSVSLSSQEIQDDNSPGSLTRSFSISLSRPRSASANAAAATSSGKRKSLRLNRSRASSARMGNKARPGADGKSPSEEETTTLQVDSAFHRIREQLAQLASEDQVLKERVEKLNTEITALITHTVVKRKKGPRPHVRTASQGEITLTSPSWSPKHFSEYHTRKGRPIPILLVSGSQDSIKIPPEMFSGSGSNSFQSEFLKGFAEQSAGTENTPTGSSATQKEGIKKKHVDSLITKTELVEIDHHSSLSQFVSNYARLETPT